MIFSAPPVRTPFQTKDSQGNDVISDVWIRWFQAISVDLSFVSPPVTGSRGGNAALQSLIQGLAALKIIQDNTTP